jgi:hypoxanthine phosphoribosyltransferase
MRKEFLSYQTVRNNAIKLADRIFRQGFTPDVIYVSLRGGAYMGNVISEYFKLVRKDRRPIYYAAVVARSYRDVGEQDKVRVDGWTYDPEYLRSGDKVLLVDDIFDTGRTVNHLVEIIMDKGIPRQDVRVAVHDYKLRRYLSRQLPVQPDYYCRFHELTTSEQDFWIHYLSHELVGLSETEKKEHYFAEDPELAGLF